ncbi:hypothetical protein RCO48_36170 [Peribacillus frigoritolerans]|nr:hypothetical protein [Peribacillus frigoritolerans]
MIGAGVRDSCGKSASKGDPADASRGGSPDRPRKASAWSGNKRSNGQTTKKTVGRLEFSNCL